VVNLAVNRESLKRMIDLIPEEKLSKLQDLLDELADSTLSKKELAEVKEAEKRIRNGKFDTIEELYEKYRDEL
jgi:hypothetical protein